MEPTIQGIKCDACDYRDDSITWDDFDKTTREWLNKPCPKCGANLLTQEDVDSTRRLIFVMSEIETLMAETPNATFTGGDEEETLQVESDGTGNKTMKGKNIEFNFTPEMLIQLETILKAPTGREMFKQLFLSNNN